MAITITTTGPIQAEQNRTDFSSVKSNSFCSPLLTTTADYAANVLDFGAKLGELVFVNMSANAVAVQFPEHYGTSKDSALIPGNATITLRKSMKDGCKLRSADTVAHSQIVVWGI